MENMIVRKTIVPKAFCSQALYILDSFTMFKNQQRVDLVRASDDRVSFTVPAYGLVAKLQDDNNFFVEYNQGSYLIRVEKKSTNFGGFYYFLYCVNCDGRYRKLYCIEGLYLCRNCAKCSYFSQRLNPYDRLIYMQNKIEGTLQNKGGSLERKPPWMKKRTYQKLKQKHEHYDRMYFEKAESVFKEKYLAVTKI